MRDAVADVFVEKPSSVALLVHDIAQQRLDQIERQRIDLVTRHARHIATPLDTPRRQVVKVRDRRRKDNVRRRPQQAGTPEEPRQQEKEIRHGYGYARRTHTEHRQLWDAEGVLPWQDLELQRVGLDEEEGRLHRGHGAEALADGVDGVGDATLGVGVVEAGAEAGGGVFDVVGDVCGGGREVGSAAGPAGSAGCEGVGSAGGELLRGRGDGASQVSACGWSTLGSW